MKNSLMLGIILTSSVLFGFQKEKAPAKTEAHTLYSEIEKVIRSVDPDVHAGIEVISLKNDHTLFQKNENQLFVPASSLKVITGAAALHILGVDYRFETKLFTDGRKRKHEIKGNLYIKGSCDPELSLHSLEELVFALKLQGIQRIDGNLYIDITDFDEIAQGPGWMWDEGAVFFNSPVSALSVNHNCIDIWVRPNAKVDEPPTIYMRPRTQFVRVTSDATVSAQEDTITVTRRWMSKENIIDITGKIPASSEPFYAQIPIEAPHFYTAHVLRELLQKNEIGVSGEIEVKAVPDAATELATFASRPLSQIVEEMMKESDNLFADTLFKKIGQVRFGGPGTWQKGSRAVRDFLVEQVGLDVERIVIMDGSGLSRYNLISPHHLTAALAWMKKQFACASEFCASLPISGMDGSLVHRMDDPMLKGKVRAKPGGMTGISSLSGYATTQDGEDLAFCIMLSGFTKKGKEYKAQIEDKICDVLVNKKLIPMTTTL
jgi:serine-type D-Ala-D-Ala carboxypeptidase/endopeptidase (penicillin-binding protein 4)